MKKFALIIGVIIVIGLVAWGVWFFAFSKKSSSNGAVGQSASFPVSQVKTQSGTSISVQGITSPKNSEVAKDFLSGIQNADQIALGGTVVASLYALQIWGDTNMGGEALLRYSSSTGWTLVSFGGGEWSVLGLMQEGVPQLAAKQLVAGLSVTSSSSTSPINIPTGNTITIGTSHGSVTTNNFYKNADYIADDQGIVVIQQTSTYDIAYDVSNSSFVLTIFSAPFETVRQAVETTFLNALGISQQDACKLSVYEDVANNVSEYIGKSFPLSFCALSTFGQ